LEFGAWKLGFHRFRDGYPDNWYGFLAEVRTKPPSLIKNGGLPFITAVIYTRRRLIVDKQESFCLSLFLRGFFVFWGS